MVTVFQISFAELPLAIIRTMLDLEIDYLSFGGNVASDEEPEEALGEGFRATLGLGQQLLTLRDRVATEADTFLRVQHGGLTHQPLDSSHASVHL